MDVNVCSRRVHDGYATIRSRGRNRPRALYRSDSEELLKEAEGPYALPRVSKDPLSDEHIHQVLPRWSDTGSNKLSENYGTLRRCKKSSDSVDEAERIVLNTFTGSKKTKRLDDSRDENIDHTEYQERLYDSVTPDNDDDTNELMRKIASQNAAKSLSLVQTEIIESLSNLYENVSEEKSSRRSARRRALEIASVKAATGQPIYAVPNVAEQGDNRRASINDGNYVPSGDLYRTAARYIEDINRNIAEIDKSYDELRTKTRGGIDSAYGVVKRIPRSKDPNDEDNDNHYAGFHRKRDALAPMPPISPNFAENADITASVAITKETIDDQATRFDFRIARPNSYGKLPPKLLPRSSSMDNNTLRHSTGSTTTTTSSSKSTESLYAISENLPEASNIQEQDLGSRGDYASLRSRSRDATKSFRHEERTEQPRRAYETWQARNIRDHRAQDLLIANEKDRRSCYVRLPSGHNPNEPHARYVDDPTDDDSIHRQPICHHNQPCQPISCYPTTNQTENRESDDCLCEEIDDRACLMTQRNIAKCQSSSYLKKTRSTNKNNREQWTIGERRYGTLPCRRSRTARPLHKSSEDVLERKCSDDSSLMQRSSISTTDVRDDARSLRNEKTRLARQLDPLYLMDATELIVRGEALRKTRKDCSVNEKPLEMIPLASVPPDDTANDDKSLFDDTNDEWTKARPFTAVLANSRTRHNSLESDDVETCLVAKCNRASHDSHIGSHGGFATLPRRANCPKEQRANVDTPRRFSGNVPVLEPLYEHAVSDPVKPRANDNGVIPWWELATRKYRHRSCPALQDHVVQAFEQSLSNMNQRLKQLTATAEKKDSELQELRETIERLRKQSAEAGLSSGSTTANGRRHTLGDSDSGTTGCAGYSNNQAPPMARQLSADSVASLNSLSSACSASSNRKKKGWLGSFSKKFSRARKNRHGSVSDAEDSKEASLTIGDLSAPNSPRLPTAAKHENNHNRGAKVNGQKSPAEHENSITGSKSSSAIYKKEDDEDVDDLKEQLRQKDLVLTDITLEALKSSGELHSLKEKIAKMKNEMKNLRENNERLQRLVTSKSLTSSQSSMPTDQERRYSMTEVAYSVAAMSNGDHHANSGDQMEDMNAATSGEHVPSAYTTTPSTEAVIEQDTDGKRINVAVYLGSEKSFNVNHVSCCNSEEGPGEPPHCVIASVCISNKTTWDALDNTVRRCFKDYVTRVDPVTNLGLGVDHVAAYHLGESSRFTNESQHPELLPCGYLIGHVKTIYLVLAGYSWLAIDTLIPKSIVQRLLSLLTEHRRLILCGPSGTGKNYLAGKLAHALVDADNDGDAKDAAAVATFNVDHKSSKELRQYLAHIAERCDSNAADELPKVIILENLQHAASLGELFSGLLGTRHSTCPAIIGTMSQATCSTTNLQLHHNFRWVLCRKDMEPVKGFLGRYLRRKLLEQQLRDTIAARNPEMATVVEWLPRVWLHLNKFLETHSSSDVTIGPSLFLSCPMEVAGSQVWFTDLWNYSIRPYLVEAVKEGNGEAAWEDPAQFITTTYPWIATHAVHGGRDALLRLRPEDVGYDVVSSGHNSGVGASSVKSLGSGHSDTEGDPLLNMLMRLQEAANYSSPHSNDSDSVTSMDSSHTRHSEDLSTSTSSSRGVESAL